MRRLIVSIGLVLAVGAVLVGTGKPEASAQINYYPSPSSCGGLQSVSEAQGGKLWVVKDCAAYVCTAGKKDEPYACVKQELKF